MSNKVTLTSGDETFEFNVDYDCITPAMIWESRHKEFARVMSSNEDYQSLGYEVQKVLIARVRRAIEVMYDNVEQWIPDGISIDEKGSLIQVQFGIIINDIEQDLVALFNATSQRAKIAKDELMNIIHEDEEDEAIDS